MRNTFNRERHSETRTMVLEALEEYLFVIGEMLKYRKQDKDIWQYPNGGTLGYPSAILLFIIVDTIGSYFRGSTLMIQVDGKQKKIAKAGYHHFYILNSEFFDLNLSENEIKAFYDIGRNKLVHNSIVGTELTLVALKREPFLEVSPYSGKGKYVVYLNSFYDVCKVAVSLFKEQQGEIFAKSTIGIAYLDINK